jgi:hypothetical protein
MAQDGAVGPSTLLSAMTFSVTLNFFTILPTKTDAVVAFPQIKENRYSSFVNLTDDIYILMRVRLPLTLCFTNTLTVELK